MSTETYLVERSTTIATGPQPIYARLVDFRSWMDWSPWEDLDPDQVRSFTGAESGVGARYAWSGNRKAGRGSMRITAAVAPAEVGIALEFEKPFRSASTITFLLTPEGPDRTRVRWSMSGPKTLATKVMGLFSSMDKMIGPDFEKGLARLKDVVETRAPR